MVKQILKICMSWRERERETVGLDEVSPSRHATFHVTLALQYARRQAETKPPPHTHSINAFSLQLELRAVFGVRRDPLADLH
jgi:hypothetical protein